MYETQLLSDGYTVTRDKPINYADSDASLFQQAFTCKIPAVQLMHGKNISVIRGLLFSARNRKFYLSYSNILPVRRKLQLKALLLMLQPARQLEKAIWITDEWTGEYFHWLTDGLTRWLVAKDAATNCPVLLPQAYEHKPYIRESLALLGIPVVYFNPRKKSRVKELFMPSHTAPTGNFNTPVIRQLRQRFLQANGNPTVTPHRKVYISREKAPKRKVGNETAIADVMKEYGFEIHYFEDYSFREQVALMAETRTLVSLHGAGLTNMLFMPEGGNIVELRNNGDGANNCFFSLASDMGHRYYYLAGKGDTPDTYNVTLEVDPERLKQILETLSA